MPQRITAPPARFKGKPHVRSSRVDTFTLVTLGRLTLLSPSGSESESLSKRRVKLALLAVLATAKRPLSRCTLAEMFWGEQDESRARHSLSDALSHLRRELGRRAIVSRGAEVSLAPDAPLFIDARLFADAVDARDLDRAAALYSGPFMDGVQIESCPSFEHWVARERRRLEMLFLQVCAQQCLVHARSREWEQCGALASRWLDAAPLSVDAALFRLNAVKAPGTREAAQRALDEFDQLSARLASEFDLAPEKPVRQLADSIRENLLTLPPEPEPEPSVAPVPALEPAREASAVVETAPAVTVVEAVRPNDPSSEPPRRRGMLRHLTRATLSRQFMRVATVGVAALTLLAAVAASARTPGSTPSRPRVAITVDVPDGDSATAWLADGLPQMIVSELARSPDVEVVPTAQVRSLLRRRGNGSISAATEQNLRDLGRRLGATVIVNGKVGRDDGSLVLDLTVRDAATGRLLHTDALSRSDAVALADEAAARVLAAVNAEGPGLRMADLETSSVRAYQHFVHAMQMAQEGRMQESSRDLDAAIALDSGFVSAVHARLDVAIAGYDTAVVDRLRARLRQSGPRATEFDRLQSGVYDAAAAGEFDRSEAIARQLIRRYPRDPRAFGVLNNVLGNRGDFAAAESMWQHAIALDSLAMEAGSGPCVPCAAYGGLTRVQWQQGKWAQAERSARRWIELQPDAPLPWEALATVLAFRQRDREAIDAVRHAVSLSGSDLGALELFARILIMSRRYDTADSLVRAWSEGPSAELRSAAHDLNVLLLRERGQFRASDTAIELVRADVPNVGFAPELMHGANLGRLGDYAGASLAFERSVHGARLEPASFPPQNPSTRGFCWHHALLADAIAPAGDTARLRAIADTLAVGCAKSFFGRDRVLHHHVRGLLAMQQGRWFEAAVELQQARWGVGEAWTRTNVALAKSQLMLGQTKLAVAVLRDAYATPLDGMGRYQPRSELDFLMAQAFQRAGQPDSAEVYMAFARRAWSGADPEVKRLLEHESVVASR